MKLSFGELIEILSMHYIFCDSVFLIRIKDDENGDVSFSHKNRRLIEYYSSMLVDKFDIDEGKYSEVIVYLEGEKDDKTQTIPARRFKIGS